MRFSLYLVIVSSFFVVCIIGSQACDPTLPFEKPCKTNEQCDAIADKNGRFLCIDHRCQKLKNCASGDDCELPKERCERKKCVPNQLCRNGDCAGSRICKDNYCVDGAFSPSSAILYFKFDEKASSDKKVLDSGSYAHHGKWSKDASYQSDGYIGQSASLHGDNKIELARHDDFKLQVFTLSVWVKLTSSGKGGSIFRTVDDAFRNGFGMEISESGKLLFYVADDNKRHDCQGLKVLPAGEWVHLAGSFDGINIRCFVNGSLKATVPWDGKITYGGGNKPFFVGGGSLSAPAQKFQGYIDEFVLFSEPRKALFLPDLKRFLYVSAKDGQKIIAIDAEKDQMDEKQSFVSPVPGSVPVALADSGKYLYLWNDKQFSLHLVDTVAKKKLASTTLPKGGQANGSFATLVRVSGAKTAFLWMWGDTTHVLPAIFKEAQKPSKSFVSLGKTFGADVSWLPALNMFAVSDTKNHQIHLFDATKPSKLPSHTIKAPGIEPLALAALTGSGELRVSFADSYDLKIYTLKNAKLTFKGSFSIQETYQNPKTGTVTEPRRISRMIGIFSEKKLYYTFEKERFIYQMDVETRFQHLLNAWLDPTDPIKQKVIQIKPLRSLYMMHLHAHGKKFYVQDGNTGRFLVVSTERRSILKEFSIHSETIEKQLPIVGVLHPSQAY